MLSTEELHELAKYKPGGLVLSLYVNTDRAVDPNRDSRVFVGSLLRKAKNAADHQDVERAQSFFDYDFTGQARGVALFSCAANDFLKIYELKVPVPDLVFVEEMPYVQPLISLMEGHPRYCLVLIDKEKARIYGFRWGELEDLGEMTNEFLHGRQKQGGWAQSRFQRHRKWGVQQHLKAVSEKLLDLFQRGEFDRLLIGRPSAEIEPLFFESLHPWLRERVGAWFDLQMFASPSEILREAVQIEQHLQEDDERELLRKLSEGLGPNKMGVAGEETYEMLQQGQLSDLIVKEGMQAPGRVCPNCGYIDALTESGPCPACAKTMEPVGDIVDRAVKLAFDHNVKIHFVKGSEDFEKMGGIGGLLRFK